MKKDVYTYRIDRSDIIIAIQDHNQWCAFAEENAWDGSPLPGDIVGHKIWEFIQDHETRHLYQEIFQRVRAGTASRTLPFRCDSPGERRFLDLTLKSLPEDQIEITSTIRRREPRNPVRLLDITAERSAELVTLCSMCKKIRIRTGTWVEIEEGLVHFKLFELDRLPGLSHGLCDDCYQSTMKELDDLEASDPRCCRP